MQVFNSGQALTLVFLVALFAVFVESVLNIWLHAEILEPIRAFVARSLTGSKRWEWITYLATCGYCMSVWLSFPCALFIPNYLGVNAAVWVLLMWMTIHRMSNLFHKTMNKVVLEPFIGNGE